MKRANIVFITIILSLFSLSISGCVEKESFDQELPEADAIVYIQNYEFHPYTTTISAGQTVGWVNNDSVAFIIKGSLAGDSFQSPTLRKGDTFTYTFEDIGVFRYELVTHPWTKGGRIVVER